LLRALLLCRLGTFCLLLVCRGLGLPLLLCRLALPLCGLAFLLMLFLPFFLRCVGQGSGS